MSSRWHHLTNASNYEREENIIHHYPINWIFWRWLVNDRQSQYIIRTNNKNNHASSGSRKQYKWHFIVWHLHMIISKQYKPRCYSSVMFHICPTSISTKAYIENNNQTSPNYLYLLLSIQTALNMIMLNIDPCWHGNPKNNMM